MRTKLNDITRINPLSARNQVRFWALYATSFYDKLFHKINKKDKLKNTYQAALKKINKSEAKEALTFFYRIRRDELDGVLNWNENMKYNTLRHIIREEIQSLLNENDLQDLEKSLKNHDWYYMMANDPKVRKRGEAELEYMYAIMNNLDRIIALRLWKKYAKKSHVSNKQFNFPEFVYNKAAKKPVPSKVKYVKNYRKGDTVLCRGDGKDGLYSRYLAKIINHIGWEKDPVTKSMIAKYGIKIIKVFSDVDNELENEGTTRIIPDYKILNKK